MSPFRSAHVDPFCRDHLPPPRRVAGAAAGRAVVALPRPAQLRHRAARRDDRRARRRPALPADARRRALDLRRAARDRQPDRARADRPSSASCPGNRVLLRGPNNPWLVACWFGVLKAGAVAVATMPMLRARELRDDPRHRQGRLWPCATTGSSPTWTPRPSRRADGALRRYGGRRPDRAGARPSRRSSPTSPPRPTTSRCSRSPPAPPAGRRRRCISTATCWPIADTFSRHVVKPTADDVFTGTPPIAFTFGLGGLVVFPLRAGASELLIEKATPVELARPHRRARRDGLLHRPDRLPRHDRLGRGGGSCRRCAGRCRPASTCGEATWRQFREATGVALIDGIGATEMLHVFISAADDDIRPGATGRAVPGYLARIVDEHGARGPGRDAGPAGRAAARPAAATSTTPASATTSRTAGTSPATPSPATPTATSGTRPAATT